MRGLVLQLVQLSLIRFMELLTGALKIKTRARYWTKLSLGNQTLFTTMA
jgi:hypothetical protein